MFEATNDEQRDIGTVTWSESAKDIILDSFGVEVTDWGGLCKDGQYLWSPANRRVTYDNFAGFIEYRGQLTAITEYFNDLVAAAKERHHRIKRERDTDA